MKLDKQFDIKRLGRVITLLKKIDEITYHMDDAEYSRFRDYIYSRGSILYPSSRKSFVGEKSTLSKEGNK